MAASYLGDAATGDVSAYMVLRTNATGPDCSSVTHPGTFFVCRTFSRRTNFGSSEGENMENPGVGWVAAIVIGGIAGWLAEMFMKSNMGVLMNIILGIVGAIVANVLLGLLGVSLTGWIGYLVAGFIGACILIAVALMIKR